MVDLPVTVIALFGGSFNPPHVAHQMACLYVLETARVDAVWMVPTYRHAFAKELVSFEHRHAMCELAAAALGDRVAVSAIERDLAQPVSRTLDTLEALIARDRDGDARFRLVIGSDILAETHKWYRWDDVARLAPPIVVGRDGYPTEDAGGHVPLLPGVSSTEVRRRLGAAERVDTLVPRAVIDYIAREDLYQ